MIHASPEGYAEHGGNYVPRPHFADVIKQNKGVAIKGQFEKLS